MELSDYLEDLRHEGTLDSEGSLTLDPHKARERLRLYRLPEPYSYIVPMVAWAVSGEARTISITCDGHGVRMEHDGRGPDLEELASLFSTQQLGLGGHLARPLRHLAMGLNAALALEPGSMTVTSPQSHLQMQDGRLTLQAQVSEGPVRFELHEPGPISLRRGLATLQHDSPELAVLKKYCSWCPIPLKVNGTRVDSSLRSGALVEREIGRLSEGDGSLVAPSRRSLPATDSLCLYMALKSELGEETRIHLVVDGIEVEADMGLSYPGLFAVVSDPSLPLDLAGSKAIEGEAFQGLKERLREQAEALYAQFLEDHPALTPACQLSGAELLDHLARRGRHEFQDQVLQLRAAAAGRMPQPAQRFRRWAEELEQAGRHSEAEKYRTLFLEAQNWPVPDPDPPNLPTWVNHAFPDRPPQRRPRWWAIAGVDPMWWFGGIFILLLWLALHTISAYQQHP